MLILFFRLHSVERIPVTFEAVKHIKLHLYGKIGFDSKLNNDTIS